MWTILQKELFWAYFLFTCTEAEGSQSCCEYEIIKINAHMLSRGICSDWFSRTYWHSSAVCLYFVFFWFVSKTPKKNWKWTRLVRWPRPCWFTGRQETCKAVRHTWIWIITTLGFVDVLGGSRVDRGATNQWIIHNLVTLVPFRLNSNLSGTLSSNFEGLF